MAAAAADIDMLVIQRCLETLKNSRSFEEVMEVATIMMNLRKTSSNTNEDFHALVNGVASRAIAKAEALKAGKPASELTAQPEPEAAATPDPHRPQMAAVLEVQRVGQRLDHSWSQAHCKRGLQVAVARTRPPPTAAAAAFASGFDAGVVTRAARWCADPSPSVRARARPSRPGCVRGGRGGASFHRPRADRCRRFRRRGWRRGCPGIGPRPCGVEPAANGGHL